MTRFQDMATQFVTDVAVLGVYPQQPLHPHDHVALRGFHDPMEMMAHQTLSMHLPFRLATGLTQGREKLLTVRIIVEDVIPLITAIHHACPAIALAAPDERWHPDIPGAIYEALPQVLIVH